MVSMGYTHKAFGNILTEQAGKDALGLRFFPLTPLSRDKLVLHDNTDILPMLLIPRAVLCGGRRREAAGSVQGCQQCCMQRHPRGHCLLHALQRSVTALGMASLLSGSDAEPAGEPSEGSAYTYTFHARSLRRVIPRHCSLPSFCITKLTEIEHDSMQPRAHLLPQLLTLPSCNLGRSAKCWDLFLQKRAW